MIHRKLGVAVAAVAATLSFAALADADYDSAVLYSKMKVSGSAYVNTGYEPKGGTIVRAKYSTDTTGNGCLYCARVDSSSRSAGNPDFSYFASVGGCLRFDYYSKTYSGTKAIVGKRVYELEVKNGAAVLSDANGEFDRVTADAAVAFDSPFTMYLFASYVWSKTGVPNGWGNYFVGEFYYLRLSEVENGEEVLKHEFVPCKVGDKVGVADRVTKTVKYDLNGSHFAIPADAEVLIMNEPHLGETTMARNEDGSWSVTIAEKANSAMLKAIACSSDGEADPIVAVGDSEVEPGASVVLTLSGFAENTGYQILAVAENDFGADTNAVGTVYTGAAAVTKVSDADEGLVKPGVFRFSIPEALPWDLVISYSVGGSAVADETYRALPGTVTVAAGELSADVEVVPVISSEVTSDVTVSVVIETGTVTGGASAELTVFNSSLNPLVRYVSTTGNDQNDGLTPASAKATLQAAVDAFGTAASENDCTVLVADGTYAQPKNGNGFCVQVGGRVTIKGMSEDPAKVTITRASDANNILMLDNAAAKLQYLTITGGQTCDNQGKGGNILLNDGVIEDCIIAKGKLAKYGNAGGGVYVVNGRISRCRFEGNLFGNADCNGVAVYLEGGGLVEDSLFVGQDCAQGGTICATSSSRVINCTVVGNKGTGYAGIKVTSTNTRIVNCAIYGNFASQSVIGSAYTAGFGSCYINCASDIPIEDGIDCSVSTRIFADWDGGDYRPVFGSPCVDGGAERGDYAAVSTTDLSGNPRAVGTVDIGCFEHQKSAADVGFDWRAEERSVPAKLSVTAGSFGLNDPDYFWTLHNDASGEDVVGTGAQTEFTISDAGSYTITVTAGGKSWTSPDVCQFAVKSLYVSDGNTLAQFPYDTPERAAADIETALAAAADGSTIYVKPGVYAIAKAMTVDKAVTIVGTGSDYRSTMVSNTVYSGNHRVFLLQHEDAMLANLTITRGFSTEDGANIYIYGRGGTVSNCLISCGLCQGNYQQSGGAAAMNAGLVTRCEVVRCNAIPSGAGNSAARVFYLLGGGARVSNCLIHDCDATDLAFSTKTFVGKGQLVTLLGNTMFDNNTIVNCVTPGTGRVIQGTANGDFTKASRVVNCAFFGNRNEEGGLAAPFGATIVWSCHWTKAIRYCASDVLIGEDRTATDQNVPAGHYESEACVVTTTDKAFASFAHGDFRPVAESPLRNAGSNELAPLPSVDFAGRRRVVKNVVDIGCYELQPAGLSLFIR